MHKPFLIALAALSISTSVQASDWVTALDEAGSDRTAHCLQMFGDYKAAGHVSKGEKKRFKTAHKAWKKRGEALKKESPEDWMKSVAYKANRQVLPSAPKTCMDWSSVKSCASKVVDWEFEGREGSPELCAEHVPWREKAIEEEAEKRKNGTYRRPRKGL